jgi:NADPH-dependent ferric siderophore reductase
MIRVVFDGPDLVDLPVGDYTDAYVKLVFPPADAPYRTAGEYAALRDGLESRHRPALRTYTIREYDVKAGELTLDFVHHGDNGVAGPWAASVQPGDEAILLGPGGGYAPDPDAEWHLLVGDESALPAIARAVERIPAGIPARVFIEVATPREEQPLTSPAQLRVQWVHRSEHDDVRGEALVAAVRAAELPTGRVHAFLHGEAGFVKQLRHHLRFERQVPKEMLSVSGYWRLGRDDEGWRAEKATWKAEVEADEQRHAS